MRSVRTCVGRRAGIGGRRRDSTRVQCGLRCVGGEHACKDQCPPTSSIYSRASAPARGGDMPISRFPRAGVRVFYGVTLRARQSAFPKTNHARMCVFTGGHFHRPSSAHPVFPRAPVYVRDVGWMSGARRARPIASAPSLAAPLCGIGAWSPDWFALLSRDAREHRRAADSVQTVVIQAPCMGARTWWAHCTARDHRQHIPPAPRDAWLLMPAAPAVELHVHPEGLAPTPAPLQRAHQDLGSCPLIVWPGGSTCA
jgi:hypothetical protein